MAAEDKLQNIKAIGQMIEGDHAIQTRTQVSLSDIKLNTDDDISIHLVGETWIGSDGEEWEQRDGYKIKKSKIDELRNSINPTVLNCPKCNKSMTSKLDFKFYKLEGMCFDCQTQFEHNLRLDGAYAEYEKNKLRLNVKSWLIDAEQETHALIEALHYKYNYINEDGSIEEWSGGVSIEAMTQTILDEFNRIKNMLIENFEL